MVILSQDFLPKNNSFLCSHQGTIYLQLKFLGSFYLGIYTHIQFDKITSVFESGIY